MSELVRAMAFAFRRKGAETMAGTELRYLLAFDLRWFAPEDAKRAVLRAIETGLLREEGDALRPSFDVRAVDVPMNFRPTSAALEEEIVAPPKLPAQPAPTAVVPPTPAAPVERAAEDERRRRGLLVSLDVARLIVRRRTGDDVAADAAALEAQLLSAGAPARP
ncbi:MAG TPA: DUF2240 family protein [Candidatus Thermoplasmatota archaeon]|nr:DUF2240 family protein [Candidatus Thermoplasmatota archaeon]